MAVGLEPGPMSPRPFSAPMSLVPSFDVIEVLPPGGAERLRKLRDHVRDLHSLTVPFEDIREASTARIQAEQRLKRLLDHQQDGGFHLKPDDPRCIEQKKLLDKLTDEFKRLNQRNEVRSAEWRTASLTLVNVEDWLKNGRPHGTSLQDHEVEPVKLLKGEDILSALDRVRRRGRELKADLARISAAPFPSSHVRSKIRAEVEALAALGVPVVSDVIEHDHSVVWPSRRLQASVYNGETPGFAATEVPDVLALLAFVLKQASARRLGCTGDRGSR